MPKLSQNRISTNYNKLVVFFLIIAVIIVIFTTYFAFSKTTVYITSKNQSVSEELEMSIVDLDGQVQNTTLENVYQYADLATAAETEEDYATGIVTIYNEYGADQRLVATTRLLSQDGILFRTQEDIIVPQGESVEIAVAADEKGESGNIGPSTFEIVALNENKKEAIYGKSEQAMTGGLKAAIIVTEDNINAAKKAAQKDLLNKALIEFQQKIPDAEISNITQIIIKEEADAEVGEQVDAINVSVAADFTYMMFNREKIIDACENALAKKNTDNYAVFFSPKKKNLTYRSENKYGKEIVFIKCTGDLIIKDDSPMLDKSKITNKTAQQVENYFMNFSEIEAVQVKLSPFWVKTTPFIKENIKIEITEL